MLRWGVVGAALLLGATACGSADSPRPPGPAPTQRASGGSAAEAGSVFVNRPVTAPPAPSAQAAGDVCEVLSPRTANEVLGPGATVEAADGRCIWRAVPPNPRTITITRIASLQQALEDYQREHKVPESVDGVGEAGLLSTYGRSWTLAFVTGTLLVQVGPGDRADVVALGRRLAADLNE